MVTIKDIKAIKILDSRANPTLKVILETDKGIFSSCVPQGKSKGKYEAISLPAEVAVRNINGIILPELRNKKIENQEELDELLIELDGTENKSKLGANAILGISLSFARVLAQAERKKLYQYLFEKYGKLFSQEFSSKMWLLFNLINGGAHSPSGPDIQEYLVLIPFNNGKGIWAASKIYNRLKEKFKKGVGDEGGFIIEEKNNEKPLQIISQILDETGMKGEVRLGMDVAYSQFKNKQSLKEFKSFLMHLIENYNLLYIEDPFDEDNWTEFRDLKNEVGKDTLIVGDDLTVSNPSRIKTAIDKDAINGIIIKPNQIGTLTETLNAIKLAYENDIKVIISHRSGDTCDDFIADLAVGINAWGLKSGAPRGSERCSKYNRLLEILQDY